MKDKRPTQLTDTEIKHLEARYYSGENIVKLIDEFKLDIHSSSLVRLFPVRVLNDLVCPYCATPMHQRPPSRTALQGGHSIPKPFCDACGHKDINSCNCKNCQCNLKKKLILQQQVFGKRLLKLKNLVRTCTINPHKCSFQQAFYLIGLCRSARCEESNLIYSIQSQEEARLAPTKSLAIEIVQSLHNQQIIGISLSNTPDSFEYEECGALEPVWDLIQFDLHLGVDEQECLIVFRQFEAILRDREKWPDLWKGELLGIWRELALYECLGYLEVILNDHGFKFRAGTKTKQILRDTLHNFSIAQTLNFIWAAVRDASGYLLRKRVSHQQAANTAVGSIQRKSERALSEGWCIKPFHRDYRCSESILAALFSHVATPLGDKYFTIAPNEASLKDE